MVFKFLQILRSYVTREQFKHILAAADSDIKFNRVRFGKTTSPKAYIKICTTCADAIIRC